MKEMKKLRKKMREVFMQYPKIKWKEKALVVNKGYPGTFNLSFNESEQLDAFGNYINFDKPLFFSKIQPVIRPNDFELLKSSHKYLSLFEIGGVSLSEPNHNLMNEHIKDIIKMMCNFLFDVIGLNREKIYIKLSFGGKIKELTNNKYKISSKISKDDISYQEWKNNGIKNFIWDKSRDTFLSLFMFKKPSPLGYRNEILYDIGKGREEKGLLDIGTMEYLLWKPIIKNDEIKNIEDWEHVGILIVVGLERILMAKNKFNKIIECDHIFLLYRKILDDAQIKNEKDVLVVTETLRTLHRILADCKEDNLGRHRKDDFNMYIKNLFLSLMSLKISNDKIIEYLKLNSQLQDYYPELKNNLKQINEVIMKSLENKYRNLN